MEVEIKCHYCGIKYMVFVFDEASLKEKRCHHCNDSNLSFKQIDPEKYIDYYQGAPAFEIKTTETPKKENVSSNEEENTSSDDKADEEHDFYDFFYF